MRLLFMLCNNCTRLGIENRIWIHDPARCTCIFLNEVGNH